MTISTRDYKQNVDCGSTARAVHAPTRVVERLANYENMQKQQQTQNVSLVLDSLIRKQHFDGKILEQNVFSRWRDVVGDAIADNAQPASFSAGILTVWTAHPMYQTELSLLKVKILTELNAKLGRAVVNDLRLKLRPVQETGSPSVPDTTGTTGAAGAIVTQQNVSSTELALTSETLTQLEVTLAGVTDEPLKDALRRLFVTQTRSAHFRCSQGVRRRG